MKSLVRKTAAALMLFLVSGCGDSASPTIPSAVDQIREQIALTPRVDNEAELASLILSEELVAPESLYVEVRDALRKVRRQYYPSVPLINEIRYSHPWGARTLFVPLSHSGILDYRAGLHGEIDSLTDLLNGEISDTVISSFSGAFGVEIQFAGYLNLELVGNMYKGLPSVGLSDESRFLPMKQNIAIDRLPDGRLALLFYDSWTDCQGNCDDTRYWYFRVAGGIAEFVGEYFDDGVNPLPDWWDEISAP